MSKPAPRGRGKKRGATAANPVPSGAAAAELSSGPGKKQPPLPTMARSKPPLQVARNGGKRRRHGQLHHEIATWWTPPRSRADNKQIIIAPAGNKNNVNPPNPSNIDLYRDGGEVTNLTSLSEGENWVICSFVEGDKPAPTATAQHEKPLQISIVKSHRNLYLDGDNHIKGGGSQVLDGAEESLAGDEDVGKANIMGEVAVLCVDVDNYGHCVAVKDIRVGMASDDHHDSEGNKVDRLEFYLARRRPQEQPSQITGKEKVASSKKKAKSKEIIKGNQKEDTLSNGSNSDGDGTSGYGTDDEKDANDEIEELNERNEVRFCDVLGTPFDLDGAKPGERGGRRIHSHPAPPREADVDKEGNLMYHHPEPLPRRQLRVLRDGDRILMRYWSPGHRKSPNNVREDAAPCMKLEYLHSQHHQERHARKPKAQLAGAEKDTCETLGKPRLLSVKSADVKSYEKKRFTLNSTSAADAPTDDDAEKKAKKAAENVDAEAGGRRKAGEDWSAIESAKKGEAMLSRQERGVRDKNNADDDDDGMEEYSYLTGEVMIKDQDYISAITGDDATTAMAADDAEDKEYNQEYDGGDAATASAVVLGATASPSKAVGKLPRGMKDDDKGNESEVDEKKCSPPEKRDEGEGDGQESHKPSSNGLEENRAAFEVEAVLDKNEGEENFLTAQMSERNSEDENNSEEELLSQPDGRDYPTKRKAESEEMGSDSDESQTDISKTQPVPIPKDVLDKARPQSDDEDDSTVCPEEENEDQKIAADDNVTQRISSAPPQPAKPTAAPESADGCDSDDNSINEPTQPWACDANDDQNVLDNGAKEAHSAPPAKPSELPDTAENDSDDFSDEEPTQKFPSLKPISNNKPNHHDEDDDVYQAQTQDEDAMFQAEEDDVFQSETQPLILPTFNSPAKSEKSEEKPGSDDGNVAVEEDQDEPMESRTSLIDQEKKPSSPNEATTPQTHKSQEREASDGTENAQNGEEECKDKPPAKEEEEEEAAPTKDERRGGAPANEAAAKPKASKDVHFELPPPSEKPSGVPENGPQNRAEEEQEPAKPPSAKEPPEQAHERRAAPRATYDDSAIQQQRLENSAVHRVSSGAIMTGPVGGAVALPGQQFTGQSKQGQPRKKHGQPQKAPPKQAQPNPLVSIALLSNDPPNPLLPDAAASSEETTVCQMMDTQAKEQASTTLNGLHNDKVARSSSQQQQEALDDRNGYADYRDRDPNMDPNIPQEVCINTRGGHGRHSNKGVTTPHHRSKRRRGNPSSGRRARESSADAVRIMFTGINPTRRHKQMISDIGAQLVDSIEEASTATHVIASDGKTKLRRTPKLMICICKTSQILSIEWLEQSAKEQRVLDTTDFLLLGDKDAEKRYSFRMAETLENGRRARLDRGGVLGDWSVYICSGVAGNNAPSQKELTLLVEATGATLLRSLSESEVSDPTKTIVITSDPCTATQRSEKGVQRVTRLGANLLSTSWLFNTIITQKISNIEKEQAATALAAAPKHRSKRKASKTPPGNRKKSSRKR